MTAPQIYRAHPLLRRSRVVWGSARLWRPRLVFWAGAIAIGLASALFAMMADAAQALFRAVIGAPGGGWRWYAPLLMTPLGFTLCAWLAATVFPGTQGSGIPQAIAARHLRDEDSRAWLLSLRIAAGKILLTVIALSCGASIGREGPTVQVGASIMLAAARWGRMAKARGLILAGSAAGIAAAFNTPLAGIVFAIEEMGRSYEARTNGLVLTAVILAGLSSLGLLGNYTYFGIARQTVTGSDWLLVIACGTIGGAAGALFSLLALRALRTVRRWQAMLPLPKALAIAFCCGLLVAAIGLASGGQTFGTGYLQARGAMEGGWLPPLYFAEKLVANLLCMVSGIPGGLFAPSLAVGAGLGSTLGMMIGGAAGTAALLGMAGYFAGVVQAPMTAFVIIAEMTGNHDNVIALMCASMLGYGTARLISRDPIYHSLARNFIADGLRRQRAEH